MFFWVVLRVIEIRYFCLRGIREVILRWGRGSYIFNFFIGCNLICFICVGRKLYFLLVIFRRFCKVFFSFSGRVFGEELEGLEMKRGVEGIG